MGVRLLISSWLQFFYNIVILYGVKQRNLFHIHFIVMYRLFLCLRGFRQILDGGQYVLRC